MYFVLVHFPWRQCCYRTQKCLIFRQTVEHVHNNWNQQKVCVYWKLWSAICNLRLHSAVIISTLWFSVWIYMWLYNVSSVFHLEDKLNIKTVLKVSHSGILHIGYSDSELWLLSGVLNGTQVFQKMDLFPCTSENVRRHLLICVPYEELISVTFPVKEGKRSWLRNIVRGLMETSQQIGCVNERQRHNSWKTWII